MTVVARGWEVVNIMNVNNATDHQLKDFAKLDNGILKYPG